MKTGSKLFLILLFVGLTSNAFAMKREREGSKEPAANAKRQRNNSDQKIEQSHLLGLPEEIIKTILTMGLSAKDLAHVCMTCTKLKPLAKPIKLTKEWEAAQDDFFELACFIERRGKDRKNYNLQHIFYACFQAALEKLKKDDEWYVRYEAFKILKALVEQEKYFVEVFQVVLDKLNDKNWWIYEGKVLQVDLVKLNDVKANVCNEAFLVLQASVEQGLYFVEIFQKIFQVALAKLNAPHWIVRTAVLGILQALVEQGYVPAYDPALQADLAKLNDEHWAVRRAVLGILQALVKQGYVPAYDPALQAALALLNDDYEDCLVRYEARKLKSLVEEKMKEQNIVE